MSTHDNDTKVYKFPVKLTPADKHRFDQVLAALEFRAGSLSKNAFYVAAAHAYADKLIADNDLDIEALRQEDIDTFTAKAGPIVGYIPNADFAEVSKLSNPDVITLWQSTTRNLHQVGQLRRNPHNPSTRPRSLRERLNAAGYTIVATEDEYERTDDEAYLIPITRR